MTGSIRQQQQIIPIQLSAAELTANFAVAAQQPHNDLRPALEAPTYIPNMAKKTAELIGQLI